MMVNALVFHNLAQIEFDSVSTNPIINIFSSEPREIPLTVAMVERHPKGSQVLFPVIRESISCCRLQR